ncbi:MAG: OsmC family protein [Nitrososphaerota archaeon]
MNIKCKLIENLRSIAENGRGHSVILDLPKENGGDDLGPTALELAIMSLAGCITTIFALIAKNSKIPIESLEVIANAEKEVKSPKLSFVKIKALVKSNADKEIIETIWKKTIQTCPVDAIFEYEIKPEYEIELIT